MGNNRYSEEGGYFFHTIKNAVYAMIRLSSTETGYTPLIERNIWGRNFDGKGRSEVEKKKKSKLLIFAVIILISFLYQLGLNTELYAMMKKVQLPSKAEVVLPPQTGFFACCAGFRLGIEEVYRVPLEEANNYSYGEKNRMVVEPFEEDCYLKNFQIGVRGFEHDCSYVYYYSDVMQLEDYREDDGYLYCHVWGRKHMGPEDGAEEWIYMISVLLVYVGTPILAILLFAKILAYFINKRIAKLRKPYGEGEQKE